MRLSQIVAASSLRSYRTSGLQLLLLVDSEDLIFTAIEDGLISVAAKEPEGSSNYRTLEELLHRIVVLLAGVREGTSETAARLITLAC
jgi:hypothetical protein